MVDEASDHPQRPAGRRLGRSLSLRLGRRLLEIAEREGIDIADIARANERAAMPDEEINRRLDAVVQAMSACIDRGMAVGGILPGGLNVKRRAPALHAC